MKLAGQHGTAEYKAMAGQLATLKDAMADVTQETGNMANDTQKLNTMNQTISAVTSTFGAYQAIISMSGEANKDLAETMKRLQIASVTISTSVDRKAHV